MANIVRLRSLLLLLAACSLPSTVAFAEDQAALLARLHQAANESSLIDPLLKPWHLKLSFKLFDNQGKPAETGQIEEWWSAPKLHKTVFTSPSYTSTEIQNEDGFFRTTGTERPPDNLALILEQAVRPLSGDDEIDQSTPDLRKETFGKVQLDCIMLAQKIKGIAYAPLGLFPTFCFDRDKTFLRASFDFGSILIVRNNIGHFLGKEVAIDQTIKEGEIVTSTAHIDTLKTFGEEQVSYEPTGEMGKTPSGLVRVGAGVIAGLIVKKVAPIYPERAKAEHVSGTVILHAIIGRDGRIHLLQPISAPDADLAISAIAAVRQWVYKPYLLNGQPTEVDTQITVNYNFGPG